MCFTSTRARPRMYHQFISKYGTTVVADAHSALLYIFSGRAPTWHPPLLSAEVGATAGVRFLNQTTTIPQNDRTHHFLMRSCQSIFRALNARRETPRMSHARYHRILYHLHRLMLDWKKGHTSGPWATNSDDGEARIECTAACDPAARPADRSREGACRSTASGRRREGVRLVSEDLEVCGCGFRERQSRCVLDSPSPALCQEEFRP